MKRKGIEAEERGGQIRHGKRVRGREKGERKKEKEG